MPPRGRSRKVGLKRIDAAIDALLPLGFSKELVRKTVDALLKVYEGDSGWVFIEEASYKLVIETILEEQEKGLVDSSCGPPIEKLELIHRKDYCGTFNPQWATTDGPSGLRNPRSFAYPMGSTV